MRRSASAKLGRYLAPDPTLPALPSHDGLGLPCVLPTIRAPTLEHDPASLTEREKFVRHALGELLANYRDVVVAYYHDDLGLHEIAENSLVSESAVRSRLHRARLRLRAILDATPHGRELRSGNPDTARPISAAG